MKTTQKINSCLWYNTQGEDAAKFYCSLFSRTKTNRIEYFGEAASQASGQKMGSVMTVDFTLENHRILALNGGPEFKFSPSLSLCVWFSTENEIDQLWKSLSSGGTIRMNLDKYPFAQKYGWTTDKFGMEWQLILIPREQKITPAFLFTDSLFGKGQEALDFYISLFEDTKIESITRDETTKTILHCNFMLAGQDFVLMEGQGTHNATFTPAFSLIVNCDTQEEIDYYWHKLSEGGATSQCGWLSDKFGVSWQITPSMMTDWMTDPKKSEQMVKEMLKMEKLDIKKLKAAYERTS